METKTEISLSDLTPTQLKALHEQLKTQRKQASGNHKERNAELDRLLQDKDDSGFKHTTAMILDALIAKNLVPASADRKQEIKKIQTRKQLLEKKLDKDGKPLYSVGYKASATGFGPLTVARILTWMESASAADLAAIAKAAKATKK